MSTAIIIHLGGDELVLDKFSTIDVSRNANGTNINISNADHDMAYNALFSQIRKSLGENDTLSITIKREKGSARFENLVVSYHLTTNGELLCFSQEFGNKKKDEQK